MSQIKEYGWWYEEGPCTHKYLFETILALLDKSKNKVILDVGCGNGFMARELIHRGYNVYGIDASVEGIDIAKKYFPDNFFIHDVEGNELPKELKGLNFDTIISTEVIEHLYDPRGFVKFCKNVLKEKSGAELIISTPYHGYLKNVLLAVSGKMDKHFTVLWDGGHIKFWSRKTLTSLLEGENFKVIGFKGTGRLPYLWKSMVVKAVIR